MRRLLLALLLGAGLAQAVDRDDPAALARPSFRVFTDREGLPQNTGQALALDTRGYVWAGTQDGLGVWNGRVFRSVRLPGERNPSRCGRSWPLPTVASGSERRGAGSSVTGTGA